MLSRQIRHRVLAASIFIGLLSNGSLSQLNPSEEASKPSVTDSGGNQACAKCHDKVYQSYMKSAMAQASGLAAENLVPGSFTHKPSGVTYGVYSADGKAWLSFERPGDPMVRGRRDLLYYIGQGRRGRTYLFSVDGFVFEAPVNWYADRQLWDMPPAYTETRQIPMNLPAVMSCLECHGSGIRPPIAGTENRYRPPVFAHPGVSCERCHGPGDAHLNGGPIVNPVKLSAKLRDQVCMQCHLEGNAAIVRAGRNVYEYKAGDDLFQYVRYFVRAGSAPGGLRAASQFEALAQSTCKKKSGDAMSCTSCHDPHRTVTKDERVSFYRAKCITCHGATFATKHHSDRPDCTACHMPAALSSDIAHTEVTDHRIPRRHREELELPALPNLLPQLVAFPASEQKEQDARDLALAWQAMFGGETGARQRQAEQLLRQALAQSRNDPALLSSLAYVEQGRGNDTQARELYEDALKYDPSSLDAATNLGVLEAKHGHVAEAIRLWQSAFERAPGRSQIGMNLGRTLCAAGRYDEARNHVLRVLQFNPDLGTAKQLLRTLNETPPRCER
jgi:Tfp pilus assembly protein PilF